MELEDDDEEDDEEEEGMLAAATAVAEEEITVPVVEMVVANGRWCMLEKCD